MTDWKARALFALRALALFVFVTVYGCGDDNALPSAASHAWINPPQVLDDKSVTLPAWLIYRVPPALLDEAVAALGSESYIQISPAMAVYYTGQEVRVPATMRPFLVRAVSAGDAPIEVIQSLAGLWVKATAVAGITPSYQPLVVFLDPTPREIFITVE